MLLRREAEVYVRNLASAIELPADGIVLDFGCGYGHVTSLLSDRVREMYFWDAAVNIRTDAAANLSRVKKAFCWHPGDATTRFDLILVNSVVQCMTPNELSAWLVRWRRILSERGRIILSDIVFPGHSLIGDMWSLFRFSVSRGYIVEAVRMALAERKRYAATAQVRELFRPTREELAALAQQANLCLEFLPRNLSHFRARHAAILTLNGSV